MRGRDIFRLFQPLIRVLVLLLRLLPRGLRGGLLAIFRGLPGLPGLGIRYVLVKSLARSCGDNVYIGPYVMLSYLESCDIGSNVSIREFCNIGCSGGLTIGDNVSLASFTVVLTTDHDHSQFDIPMRSAPTIKSPVVIEDGVWIGTQVVVTSGVTIGHETAVGSGAVVTKDIPPYSIAVGVPAKVIKSRRAPQEDQSSSASARA